MLDSVGALVHITHTNNIEGWLMSWKLSQFESERFKTRIAEVHFLLHWMGAIWTWELKEPNLKNLAYTLSPFQTGLWRPSSLNWNGMLSTSNLTKDHNQYQHVAAPDPRRYLTNSMFFILAVWVQISTTAASNADSALGFQCVFPCLLILLLLQCYLPFLLGFLCFSPTRECFLASCTK